MFSGMNKLAQPFYHIICSVLFLQCSTIYCLLRFYLLHKIMSYNILLHVTLYFAHTHALHFPILLPHLMSLGLFPPPANTPHYGSHAIYMDSVHKRKYIFVFLTPATILTCISFSSSLPKFFLYFHAIARFNILIAHESIYVNTCLYDFNLFHLI